MLQVASGSRKNAAYSHGIKARRMEEIKLKLFGLMAYIEMIMYACSFGVFQLAASQEVLPIIKKVAPIARVLFPGSECCLPSFETSLNFP